jgi:hypothetical protein
VGKLYKPFDTRDPVATITPQVNQWLSDKGLSRRFIGSWRMVNENTGTTTFTMTLDEAGQARKSHVPEATGKWEVIGEEARITWNDGWRDILRPDTVGMRKFAYPPGSKWPGTPDNTERAIKED